MEIKHLVIFSLMIYAGPLAQAFGVPGKNYKVLKSVDVTNIDEKGVAVHTTENVTKITTEAGRVDLALHKIRLVNSSDKFTLIEAYVDNGGKKFKISPSDVKISHNRSYAFGIVDIQEAIIPLSNLQVNSEIHLKYSITSAPSIGNLYTGIFSVANNCGVYRLSSGPGGHS